MVLKIKRFLKSNTPQTPKKSPLYMSLQQKIKQYEMIHGVNLDKTYSIFLEISNPSIKKQNQNKIKNENENDFAKLNKETLILTSFKKEKMRKTHTSLNLNDTKVMKKSRMSIMKFEKSLKEDEGKSLNTIIKKFSIAEALTTDLSQIYKNNEVLLRNKSEILKEKLNDIWSYLENLNELVNFKANYMKTSSFFFKKKSRPFINSFSKKKTLIDNESTNSKFMNNPKILKEGISSFTNKFFHEEINVAFQRKQNNIASLDNLENSLEINDEKERKEKYSNNFQRIKEAYDDYLIGLISLIHSHNLKELYIYAILLHAKICFESKEINKAIVIIKQAKNIANDTGLWILKMKCYEKLGKCFQTLKNFPLALKYYLKMLELALYNNSKAKELLAYDLIGIQYFYIGDLNLANFFHKKLLEGDIEAQNSNLRKIASIKYKYKPLMSNYSLPSYIALRSEVLSAVDSFLIPSSEENSEIKIEELLGKYNNNKKSVGDWLANSKGFVNKKLVFQEANKNIRRIKKQNLTISSFDSFLNCEFIDFNKVLKRYSSKSNDIIQNHPFLRLNHLSPNRYFARPNVYEFRMNKLTKEETEKLEKRVILINERYVDKMSIRFQSFLEKFKNNIRVALLQIEFYIAKSKDKSERKNALYCSPFLKKFEIKIPKENKTEDNTH